MKRYFVIINILAAAICFSCAPKSGTDEYAVNRAWQTYRSNCLAIADAKEANDFRTIYASRDYFTNVCSPELLGGIRFSADAGRALKLTQGVTFSRNLRGIRVSGNTAEATIVKGLTAQFVKTNDKWKINSFE